jgi:prepilin-type N-terminal cleavage/methylation domain-containing protein
MLLAGTAYDTLRGCLSIESLTPGADILMNSRLIDVVSTTISREEQEVRRERANASCRHNRFCFYSSASLCSPLPGFTLLELAVVLLIIGLVLMIAMPHFGAFQTAELRSEAHRLATRSHYLYEEAGAQKVLLRLNLDLNHSSYFVTRLDPFAPSPFFTPENGPAGGTVTMPADVRLRDVWVEGGGLFRSGIVACQFYPSSVADAAIIHLVDRNGAVMTIGIDPFTGAVATFPGDFSPDALAKYANQ